jgi:hypothetical protein
MMKVSANDNVAAQYESCQARKILTYCSTNGKCVDFFSGFDNFSTG